MFGIAALDASSQCFPRLFYRQIERLHHAAPLVHFGLEHGVGLRRRSCDQIKTHVGQFFLHLGRLHDGVDGAIECGNDLRIGLGRREEADPGRGGEAWETLFGVSRHVRRDGRALVGGDAETFELAAFDPRRRRA